MSEPSIEELNNSIDALTSYKNRLKKEIISISQKLQMPSKKIDATLQEHSELKKLESTIETLKIQRDTLL